MTLPPLLETILGLALLLAGGEILVRGASRMARALGVPPLIVGLTVVAFATSAPEGAVSIQAALRGTPGVALGNVLGSNAFNILVVLGLSSVIYPMRVERQLIRLDVPTLMGASLLVLFLALDGALGQSDGGLLLGLGFAYVILLVLLALRHVDAPPGPENGTAVPGGAPLHGFRYRAADLGMMLLGLAGLVGGADLLVEGSVTIARSLGASELVIGLTLVAAGTSLPEAATSVVASLRGERSLAVGNVVGSNLFNLFFVLGGAAALGPGGIHVPSGALTFDMPVMVAVALACFPIFFTSRTIGRWEGALFLLYYFIYVGLLILDASDHDTRNLVLEAVLQFVLPLTAITAILGWWKNSEERDEVRRAAEDSRNSP